MPRYGQFKYSQAKYGIYDIEVSHDTNLRQLKKFRLRTINSNKVEGSSIITEKIESSRIKAVGKVRLRSAQGEWVVGETISLPSQHQSLRMKSIDPQGTESPWVECVVGTIRKKVYHE